MQGPENTPRFVPFDPDQVRQYLQLLDPDPNAIFCFRCIWPKENGAPRRMPSKHTGRLTDRLLKTLINKNAKGYGVYVVVNKGGLFDVAHPDGTHEMMWLGDDIEHIRQIRAVFGDFDAHDAHLKTLNTAMPPTFYVLSSPGKAHTYWLPTALSGEGSLSLAEYTACQQAIIARFGGDVAVKDLPRIMRLPGLFHNKHDNPANYRVATVDGKLGIEFVSPGAKPWVRSELVVPPGDIECIDGADIIAWLKAKPVVPIVPGGPTGDLGDDLRALELPEASGRTLEQDEALIRTASNLHGGMVGMCGRWAAQALSRDKAYAKLEVLLQAAEASGTLTPEREGRIATIRETEFDSVYAYCTKKEASKQKAFGMPLEEMLARYVLVVRGERVFDRKYPRGTITLKEFRTSTKGSYQKVLGPNGKLYRRATADLWLEQITDEQRVRDITFEAGGPQIIGEGDQRMANTWDGWAVQPTEGDCSLILEHIELLFGDRTHEFLEWLAHIAQCPGELPHTCWLHVSHETGSGRGQLERLLLKVFAGHSAGSIDLEAMFTGSYNSELSGVCLAVVPEAREGGSERWKHSAKLKALTTAETRVVNAKYGGRTIEKNACRWLFCSNHISAIPIDKEDRRVEVVEYSGEPMSEAYYRALGDHIADPAHVSAFMGFLMRFDISHFNQWRRAKETAAKDRAVVANQAEEHDCILRLYRDWTGPLIAISTLKLHSRMVTASNRSLGKMIEDAGWQVVGSYATVKGARDLERVYCKDRRPDYWARKGVKLIRKALATGALPPEVDDGDDGEELDIPLRDELQAARERKGRGY